MPESGNPAPLALTEAQAAEQKMRRALGLHGNNKGGAGNQQRTPQQRPDQARQRHRFVQDGGVPVVMVSHRAEDGNVLKERITDLERQLEAERSQHANTRRALQEAQATANAIETRLVHAGLAHQEALAQERRALFSAQQALNEALAQAATRRSRMSSAAERAETAETVPEPGSQPASQPGPQPARAGATAAEAAKDPAAQPPDGAVKKRGRPRTRPLPEPKPVRWWTPSFRAKKA